MTTTNSQPSATPADDQSRQVESLVTDLKGFSTELKALPASIKNVQDEQTQLRQQLAEVRRSRLVRSGIAAPRRTGEVSPECARHLAAHFIAHCERSGKL